jgi:hypothetical protein
MRMSYILKLSDANSDVLCYNRTLQYFQQISITLREARDISECQDLTLNKFTNSNLPNFLKILYKLPNTGSLTPI